MSDKFYFPIPSLHPSTSSDLSSPKIVAYKSSNQVRKLFINIIIISFFVSAVVVRNNYLYLPNERERRSYRIIIGDTQQWHWKGIWLGCGATNCWDSLWIHRRPSIWTLSSIISSQYMRKAFKQLLILWTQGWEGLVRQWATLFSPIDFLNSSTGQRKYVHVRPWIFNWIRVPWELNIPTEEWNRQLAWLIHNFLLRRAVCHHPLTHSARSRQHPTSHRKRTF